MSCYDSYMDIKEDDFIAIAKALAGSRRVSGTQEFDLDFCPCCGSTASCVGNCSMGRAMVIAHEKMREIKASRSPGKKCQQAVGDEYYCICGRETYHKGNCRCWCG